MKNEVMASPTFSGNTLCWYEGDTVAVDFKITFKDENGYTRGLKATDEVKIVFKDTAKREVISYTFSGITDEKITLWIDETDSALFKKGMYSLIMAVSYDEGERRQRTTIEDNMRVVVN